jgi:hypothetical protein
MVAFSGMMKNIVAKVCISGKSGYSERNMEQYLFRVTVSVPKEFV